MRKLITILMIIMTLLAIISCNGNTPKEIIVPPATTGTLSIDFCNFFGATMHYDIYPEFCSNN